MINFSQNFIESDVNIRISLAVPYNSKVFKILSNNLIYFQLIIVINHYEVEFSNCGVKLWLGVDKIFA